MSDLTEIGNVIFPSASGYQCSHCWKSFGAGEEIVVVWCFLPQIPMRDHFPQGIYHERCYVPRPNGLTDKVMAHRIEHAALADLHAPGHREGQREG